MRFTLRSLALLTFIPAAVAAQEPSPDSVLADSAMLLRALTVRGVRAPAVTLPLAVTRVDKSARFGAAGRGLDEALGMVPGVIAQSRSGGTDIRLTIRGYGSRGAGDRSNSGTSRGVRVLLDGIPETEPDGRTSFDQIDLGTIEAIEVIRSNATSLWGNAAGGVVSLSTIDEGGPGRLSLSSEAGGFGLRRGVLRGQTPLGRGDASAALTRTQVDGWRAHSGGERTLATVSLLGAVGNATRVGVYAVASNNAFRIPGPLTRAQVDSAPRQANATYAARDERRHNRLGRLAVTVDHPLAPQSGVSAMLYVSPKYLERSERNTYRQFTRYHVGGNLVGRTRVRFGERAAGTLLFGMDEAYQDGAILFYQLSPQNTRGDTLRDNRREGANNLGLFVQQELAIGERLGATIGARYDAIAYFAQSYIPGGPPDDRRTFSRVSPRLAVSWRLGAQRAVYASLGGGVEAPAGNETDPVSTFGQDTIYGINPLLAPITSTSLELGTRQLLAARGWTVSYDLAAYRTVVKNEIIPYRGGRFYVSAGEARRSGLELGASAHRPGGLQLASAFTFSHHRYADYTVDSVHYVPGSTAHADFAGNRVVGVPDLAYTVSLGWELDGRAPLMARVVVQGMSRWFADDANTVIVPAFRIANVVLGAERPILVGGGIGVRGFLAVNNVLDARYIGSAFLNPDVVGGVPVAFEPGLPRHVVVSVSLERTSAR